MKNIVSVFLIVSTFSFVHSQQNEIESINPYYDALLLRLYIDSSTKKFKVETKDSISIQDYLTVFQAYFPESMADLQNFVTEVQDTIQTENYNPFISELFDADVVEGLADEFVSGSEVSQKTLNPVSGFNTTTLIDGLAKFLVERTKQELTITFFKKFKEDLEHFQELKLLFPNTYTLLLSIGDEIYNFSGYINMLRETFQEDLKTIIPNLRTYINSDLLKDYFAQKPLIKDILDNALLVAQELQNGKHPGDVLTTLKEHNRNNTTINNFGPSLEVLDLISQSLRSTSEDRYWITSDQIKELFKGDDNVTLNIYLGLLYQQAKGIAFEGADPQKTFQEVLQELKSSTQLYSDNIASIKVFLKALIANAQRVDRSLKAIEELNIGDKQKSTYNEHYEFYTASIDLLEHSLSLADIPILSQYINLNKVDFEKYFDLAHVAGDLYLDIREKQYFGAILNLQSALEKSVFEETQLKEFYSDNLTTIKQDIQTLLPKVKLVNSNVLSDVGTFLGRHTFFEQQKTYVALKDYWNKLEQDNLDKEKINGLVKNLNAIIKEITENSDSILNEFVRKYKGVLPKLLKYGNLAAGIAQAENSEEVKKIIESIALPAGSASIKKKSKSNVALNAYVGLSPGMERNGDTGDLGFTFGVNAPIGVALSRGWYRAGKDGAFTEKGSGTWFLSLLDIGAVTSFRFGDNKTEELPEFKFENIFAPGIYYVAGLAKWPISIGLGGQLGPQLRSVTASATNVDSDLALTVKAFIAVDIPLLNFYTRSRE